MARIKRVTCKLLIVILDNYHARVISSDFLTKTESLKEFVHTRLYDLARFEITRNQWNRPFLFLLLRLFFAERSPLPRDSTWPSACGKSVIPPAKNRKYVKVKRSSAVGESTNRSRRTLTRIYNGSNTCTFLPLVPPSAN